MCTEKYINPFTAFGFKLLFGTPANKDILIAILNSLLDLAHPIVDITYNNTEVFGKSPDDRKAVYDLYCETDDGLHIIVEMQNAYQRYFMDRTIYYSSFPIQAAANRGEWDYQLPQIYTVAFLNFNMSEYVGDPGYKHVVKLMDVDKKKVFFDKLTYIYLEMPKFNKEENDLNGFAEYWLYAIKNLVVLNEMPKKLQTRIFDKFFRVAEIARFTPEQRAAYETSLKIMRDYNNTVRSAEDKGREEGIKEGIKEGITQGREEEQLLIAKSMLEQGLDARMVAKITGLSTEDLSKI